MSDSSSTEAARRRRLHHHAGRLHYHARRHFTRDVIREVTIAIGAFFIYFGVRGFTEGSVAQAEANAHDLFAFEQWLRLDFEHAIQETATSSEWLIDIANWIYIWGHWPVIAVVASWLLLTRPQDYRLIRNSFLISGGIGLIIFATYPVAPPRLIDIDLVDTVTERSQAYRVLQPPAFVNQYAALPSLHFGWDLLIGMSLVRFARRWWLRVIGVVLPFAMAYAIVATANHFVIDGIAGGALALAGLAAAWGIERRKRARENPMEMPAL